MKLLRVTCLLSLACMLVLSQTALAADSAPSFNWTGPYAGVHFGYGWSNADTNFQTLPPNYGSESLPWTLSQDPGGVVGGVQAGYNYQMGCFVVGIEADFSVSGMSGSASISPIPHEGGPAPGVLSTQESISWFGTLRPRLGYTVMPNVLIYATGGLAYGDASYSANHDFQGGIQYPVSVSTTKVGWALGGGVEYALCRNWTVKAEYLYMDLGSESALANPIPPNPPYQQASQWQTTANVFQVGVNHKF